jgi:hypothetical protein
VLVLAVTPGWCALRGWCLARAAPAPESLSDWLPPAAALGLTWSGVLYLACGDGGLLLAAADAGRAARVAVWIGVATALWVAPFVLAWAAGRAWRPNGRLAGAHLRVLLKDGTAVEGRCLAGGRATLTLGDAAIGDRRAAEVHIPRDEVHAILRDPRPFAPRPAAGTQRSMTPREAILDLLARRDEGKTICPSEAARASGASMDEVRAEARRLVGEGEIVVTQKGEVVDLDEARGPIRLRRSGARR